MSAPVVLDPQCPQGTYTLSLGQKAERAVALGLIRLDAEAEGGPGQHLRNVRLNGNEVGALTERGWPDKLPALGLLEADFTRLPELAVQHVLDFKKVANLEREFQKDSTTDLTKMKTLLTVAPYSYLYAAQIAKLLRCIGTGDMLVRAACVLFTRCVDLEDGGYTTILRALPERDQYFVRLTLGSTGCFKGSNPTGHYELNLSIAAQRMLAVRLKDAALDEGQAHTWRNVLCAPAGLRACCSCVAHGRSWSGRGWRAGMSAPPRRCAFSTRRGRPRTGPLSFRRRVCSPSTTCPAAWPPQTRPSSRMRAWRSSCGTAEFRCTMAGPSYQRVRRRLDILLSAPA